MALAFLDNIDYKGKKPNFQRDQFDTLVDMKDFSDNYLPDTFIATCVETGKAYLYNKSNTVDADTGKWRELGSGSAAVEDKPAPPEVKDKFFYYGVSASNTVTDVAGLTKKKLELAETSITVNTVLEYVVIAVPKSDLTLNIYDENGLCYNSSFIRTAITVDGEDYYVYVSEDQSYCVDFIYKIKY